VTLTLRLVIKNFDTIDNINSYIDPYLRALVANIARVIRNVDEEEVLSCYNYTVVACKVWGSKSGDLSVRLANVVM
jgi:hypothetical protein